MVENGSIDVLRKKIIPIAFAILSSALPNDEMILDKYNSVTDPYVPLQLMKMGWTAWIMSEGHISPSSPTRPAGESERRMARTASSHQSHHWNE